MLKGKTVLIGITGGIAAYKICELVRMYKRQGANVKIILTHAAENFVTKLTLQSLSANAVITDTFEPVEYKPEHVSLADECDIFVIAPATANTISKIAHGICDNMLTSTVCAFHKPIIIAPAMNSAMWENKTIQENIRKVKSYGYEILDPEEGFLACGTTGSGRLCALEKIYEKTVELLLQKKTLANKKIIVTAGGTVEKIDPVRFISNFSSGKMGEEIADEAFRQGADVVLVSTTPKNKPYKTICAPSAQEMQNAVENEFETSDCVVMAAAVADFRVKNYQEQKIKKTNDAKEMTIELVKNPDILKEISAKKGDKIIVGFSAESENLLDNATEKLKRKGCDFIVANDITLAGCGFSSDYNEVYVIDKNLNMTHIEKTTKKEIAKQLLEKVFE